MNALGRTSDADIQKPAFRFRVHDAVLGSIVPRLTVQTGEIDMIPFLALDSVNGGQHHAFAGHFAICARHRPGNAFAVQRR